MSIANTRLYDLFSQVPRTPHTYPIPLNDRKDCIIRLRLRDDLFVASPDAARRAQKRQQARQARQARPGQQGLAVPPQTPPTDTADTHDVSLLIRAQAAEIASLVTPRTGRPGIESDTTAVQKFLSALADGNYRVVACRLAGISQQTFYNVQQRAEQGELAARAFMEATEKAEAIAEAEMVGLVRNAARRGPQYWVAAATHLERRAPDRWGKRVDDASGPRVVVQIGTQSGAQDVNIITSALQHSPQLSD